MDNPQILDAGTLGNMGEGDGTPLATHKPVRCDPVMGESALPDLPTGVGLWITGAYGALLLSFLALYTGSRSSTMMVVIVGVFLAVFWGVPAIFLRIEPRRAHKPGYADFVERGVQTWTGHVSGREAIVQMVFVPVMVFVGVTIIGIMASFML